MYSRVVLAVLALFLSIGTAQADVIRLYFKGGISSSGASDPLVNAYFGLPETWDEVPVSGFIEYDPSIPAMWDDGTYAQYLRGDFEITVNGVTASSPVTGPGYGVPATDFVRVVNDSQDSFIYSGIEIVELGDGNRYFLSLGIYLYLLANTFSDTSLPLDGSFYEWPSLGYSSNLGFGPAGLGNVCWYPSECLTTDYSLFILGMSTTPFEEDVVTVAAPLGMIWLAGLGFMALRIRRRPGQD